jgi:phospho-N-acetylmuramoyl-pentapeptide-transferase
MLYYLYLLKGLFSPLNVFQYITFRAAGAFLTALGISFVTGPSIISWLRAKKAKTIRVDTPAHHQTKAGTPTMGGIIIYLAMMGSALFWARLQDRFVLLILISSTVLWIIGFVDDYLKSKVHRKDGLSASVKMTAQLVLSLFVAAYLYIDPPNIAFATHISVPYSKEWVLNLGALYIPFCMMLLVGSSNAVNLADGLDGLAAGTIVICALTYGVFAYLAGNIRFSQYLRLIPVPGAGELTVVVAAMVGASLGFLWYNSYPAEIFMGDTGSLFLGGVVGLIALCVKQELLLLIVGGIFVAEALSVLIQVYSFRVHKRRLFKMAPLHHHFELIGWPESKVTIRFWIVAVVLALFALASLKLRGRRFAVIGAGRSGLAAAQFLRKHGASVLLSEGADRPVQALPGIDVETGGHSQRVLEAEVIIRSPGVPNHLPILEEANRLGIAQWSELELASRFIDAHHMVAITGTNGKTTTTTLIGQIFKMANSRTVVGGNIGTPLTELASKISPKTDVILEVSSYQLENIQLFHPHIAVLLNITPDHLEHHGTMKAYRAAKARIFERQNARDFCIINADDPRCVSLARHAKSKVVFFSRHKKLRQGVYFDRGQIVVRWGKINRAWTLQWNLPGDHNVENALAAVATALVAGIPLSIIQDVLDSFKGVEHRLERVRMLHDVCYVNDSKATNVDSTRVALASFREPLIVIMGGRGKGSPYRSLSGLIKKHVKKILLIGEDSARIEKDLNEVVSLERCHTLDRAVRRARQLAVAGDVVLLSPACASFDQYRNYEERGKHFKKLVKSL